MRNEGSDHRDLGGPIVEVDVHVNEVVVSRELYESLKEDSAFLQALMGAGVDNWEGYDLATEAIE